jgi:hypothetical protein
MSAAGGGSAGEHRPTFGAARLAEETRERFVREVIARVPLARMVELYLFSPMRQGGMESGVAVLAATIDVPVDATDPAPTADAAVAAGPSGDAAAAASLATLPEPPALEPAPDAAVDPVPDGDPTEVAAGPPPTASDAEDAARTADEASPADTPSADAPTEAGPTEAEPATDDLPDHLPDAAIDHAALEVTADAPPEAALAAVLEAVPERAPEPAPRPAVRRRLTVFTARYRLVIKGPERGKWDVEVREEADAPLVTVEAVVRGVQQRAGDAAEPERLDAAGVARMLGVPLPDAGGAPAP